MQLGQFNGVFFTKRFMDVEEKKYSQICIQTLVLMENFLNQDEMLQVIARMLLAHGAKNCMNAEEMDGLLTRMKEDYVRTIWPIVAKTMEEFEKEKKPNP